MGRGSAGASGSLAASGAPSPAPSGVTEGTDKTDGTDHSSSMNANDHVWKVALDKKTGRAYFYNKVTRETRWERPDDFGEATGSAAAAANSASAAPDDEGELTDEQLTDEEELTDEQLTDEVGNDDEGDRDWDPEVLRRQPERGEVARDNSASVAASGSTAEPTSAGPLQSASTAEDAAPPPSASCTGISREKRWVYLCAIDDVLREISSNGSGAGGINRRLKDQFEGREDELLSELNKVCEQVRQEGEPEKDEDEECGVCSGPAEEQEDIPFDEIPFDESPPKTMKTAPAVKKEKKPNVDAVTLLRDLERRDAEAQKEKDAQREKEEKSKKAKEAWREKKSKKLPSASETAALGVCAAPTAPETGTASHATVPASNTVDARGLLRDLALRGGADALCAHPITRRPSPVAESRGVDPSLALVRSVASEGSARQSLAMVASDGMGVERTLSTGTPTPPPPTLRSLVVAEAALSATSGAYPRSDHAIDSQGVPPIGGKSRPIDVVGMIAGPRNGREARGAALADESLGSYAADNEGNEAVSTDVDLGGMGGEWTDGSTYAADDENGDEISALTGTEEDAAASRKRVSTARKKGRRIVVARRKRQLNEAFRKGDWDEAASLTDDLRSVHSGSDMSEEKAEPDSSAPSPPQEWTQTELDEFIANNNWNSVSQYIASMRDQGAGTGAPPQHLLHNQLSPIGEGSGNGIGGGPVPLQSKLRPSSINDRTVTTHSSGASSNLMLEKTSPSPEDLSGRVADGANATALVTAVGSFPGNRVPRKRFGARSQLQYGSNDELSDEEDDEESTYYTESEMEDEDMSATFSDWESQTSGPSYRSIVEKAEKAGMYRTIGGRGASRDWSMDGSSMSRSRSKDGKWTRKTRMV
uniref:WW domain-containing protein n=1 Tax=Odontella aurita TaxID=265563 RepID=A0A7S4N8B7_9STRA